MCRVASLRVGVLTMGICLTACGAQSTEGSAPPVLETTASLTTEGDESEDRYAATELMRGVQVAVDDTDGLIDSATVFLPDDLPSFLSVQPQLDEEGVAVLQPGEGGYDVVVVYLAGPYCGLLPDVSVESLGKSIRAVIESRTEDECDDMQYAEAIGFQLVAGHEADPVEATHVGRPQTEN